MIKKDRGQGSGDAYKSWITIQDVHSLRRVTKLKEIKIGRQHEFLPDIEKSYFYFSEFSDGIVDIRGFSILYTSPI